MQIDSDTLSKNQMIWYRYSGYPTVYGPFTVKKVFSNHQGPHAVLTDGNEERTVRLADDDDFGSLLLYDSKPEDT